MRAKYCALGLITSWRLGTRSSMVNFYLIRITNASSLNHRFKMEQIKPQQAIEKTIKARLLRHSQAKVRKMLDRS